MSTRATRAHDVFATTRWTVVLSARREGSTHARDALAQLCQTYWFPLYAYVRRRGHAAEDAEDLTQGFFERLLKVEPFAGLSRGRGKFRAFLLASMNHFLADHHDRQTAQKRDTRRTISLNRTEAEGRYLAELSDPQTPERAFERQWALTLLETVVRRLHDEHTAAGRGALFMALRFTIAGGMKVAYAELAKTLGISEEAVRVDVHRLRQRYRTVLREEIAHTVSEADDVNEELNALRSALAG